ncbi:MAG: DUF3791 domain-containing protein [Prevotella sp.]|nr:DUF3791 domain-containing protein [Prevotella sp.]
MQKIVEISQTQVVMSFIATCIEATARQLGVGYKEIYDRMKRVGLIEKYILPGYEPLHSESRENIAQAIANCLKEWEKRYGQD